MKVQLLYFAAVRDVLGLESEELELPDGVNTVAELAGYLVQLHPTLGGKLAAVRFAVNEEFAEAGAGLHAGDAIAVIPPVAGG